MLGKLTVKPINAQLVKNKDTVGQMDPYVTLRLGDQYYQTVPAVEQGFTPSWNEQFTFNVSKDDRLKIKVFDKDVAKDDFLGKINIWVSQITQRPHFQGYFDLHSRILGRVLGKILLSFDWYPQEKPIVIPPQHGFVMPAQTTQVFTQVPQSGYVLPPQRSHYAQSQLNQQGYSIPPQQTEVINSNAYSTHSQNYLSDMRPNQNLYSSNQYVYSNQNYVPSLPISSGYKITYDVPTSYSTETHYTQPLLQAETHYTQPLLQAETHYTQPLSHSHNYLNNQYAYQDTYGTYQSYPHHQYRDKIDSFTSNRQTLGYEHQNQALQGISQGQTNSGLLPNQVSSQNVRQSTPMYSSMTQSYTAPATGYNNRLLETPKKDYVITKHEEVTIEEYNNPVSGASKIMPSYQQTPIAQNLDYDARARLDKLTDAEKQRI